MGKVENAITKQVQQKMPETDSWFEERAQQVDALQVRKMAKLAAFSVDLPSNTTWDYFCLTRNYFNC